MWRVRVLGRGQHPVAVTLALPALSITDGGLHLESAEAFDGLITGRWTGLVHWTGTLPPNLLVELVLGFLVRIMDPEWALRVLACLLLLGFAAGASRLGAAVSRNKHHSRHLAELQLRWTSTTSSGSADV